MPLRFAHTGDFHFGYGFPYLPPGKAEARRADLRVAFFRAIREARAWGAQVLLLTGDLFDGPEADERDVRVIVKNLRAHAKSGMRCFAVPGNHDPAGPGSAWERADLGEVVHLFSRDPAEGLQPVHIDAWNLTLAGIPWDPEKVRRPPLREILGTEIPTRRRAILLMHASEASLAPMHPAFEEHPFDAADLARLPFGYVALGHYHRPVEVARWNGAAACYSGSPEGINLSRQNEGECSIVLGEMDGEGRLIRLERRPVNARTIRLLRFQAGDGTVPDDWFRAADALRDPDTLLRMTVPEIEGPARRRAEVLLSALEHEFFHMEVIWEPVA